MSFQTARNRPNDPATRDAWEMQPWIAVLSEKTDNIHKILNGQDVIEYTNQTWAQFDMVVTCS